MVLGGGVFNASSHVGKLFPMIEMVPMVGDGTWVGECPPVLTCHSGLGIENIVSQRIQTNMHKIGKMMLQWK